MDAATVVRILMRGWKPTIAPKAFPSLLKAPHEPFSGANIAGPMIALGGAAATDFRPPDSASRMADEWNNELRKLPSDQKVWPY